VAALCGMLLFGRSIQPAGRHEDIEALGIMLIVIGILGRLWAILYIGGLKSSTVVATGPYSITRNPLYLFSTVAAAGVGAQTGSVTGAVGFALLCAIVFRVVIRREEEFLREKLGQPYEDYLTRVPRFWPDPRLYRDAKRVTFAPRALVQTFLDGLFFFVAFPAFELIEQGQGAGFIPVLFHLF
jgi:protein-S-isoprenylcysteine O-methyltransferase Ste14